MTDPWPMHAGQVLLRSATADDVERLLEFRNDPAANRFMLRTSVDPDAFRAEWLATSDTDFSCVAELDGVVVAMGFLELVDGMGQPGMPTRTEAVIGYLVDPAYAGRGIASDLARGLLAAAFEHLGVRRVVASCNADNHASVRVLEKAGMRREQHGIEDSWHAELGWVDGYQYAMLRREWEEARDVSATGEIRAPMYEAFADAFDVHAATSAYNALYDRPAVLEVVGDVAGLRVLDAGCGPGYYAAALAEAGATVTAFDASPRMVELARERLGDAGDVRVADLEEPLTWLADDSVDLAVLALVIHHVERRVQMLRELRRVLRPGGRLVVSTVHPTADWLRLGGSYADRGWVEEEWNDGWRVRFWRQPLGAWTDEFAEAGLLLDRVVEPLPTEEMRTVAPASYAELTRAPGFIIFSLSKPADPTAG